MGWAGHTQIRERSTTPNQRRGGRRRLRLPRDPEAFHRHRSKSVHRAEPRLSRGFRSQNGPGGPGGRGGPGGWAALMDLAAAARSRRTGPRLIVGLPQPQSLHNGAAGVSVCVLGFACACWALRVCAGRKNRRYSAVSAHARPSTHTQSPQRTRKAVSAHAKPSAHTQRRQRTRKALSAHSTPSARTQRPGRRTLMRREDARRRPRRKVVILAK